MEGTRKTPLVLAKLGPPQPGRVLSRPRLLAALGADAGGRITVIAAPAGYGKTTLLADFAARAGTPAAWYRLDRADRDPAAFIAHLLEAVRLVDPSFGRGVQARLAVLQDFAREGAALLAELANALAARRGDLAVILDDLHAVDETSEIAAGLSFLIENSPPWVRWFLAGRREPALPLARWQARDLLARLGPEDLRFDLDELRALCRSWGRPVGEDDARLLLERTEGWAVILVLLLGSGKRLRGGGLESLSAGAASSRDTFRYVAEEVVSELPPDLARFMLRTSVLQRLDPRAAALLAGVGDARPFLRRLFDRGLAIACDPPGHFRYHSLVRSFLEQRLAESEGEEAVRRLHLLAADHLAGRGELEPAVEHHLAAGATDAAAATSVALAGRLFREGRFHLVAYLVDRFPGGVQEDHPGLIILRGRVMEVWGRLAEAAGDYRRALAAARRRGQRGVMGEAFLRLGGLAQQCHETEAALEALEQAGNLLGRERRAEVDCLLGAAHLGSGQLALAREHLRAALDEAQAAGDREVEGRALFYLGLLGTVTGDLHQAYLRLAEASDLMKGIGRPQDALAVALPMTYLLLWRNRWPEAVDLARAALAESRSLGVRRFEGWNLIGLSAALTDAGDAAGAEAAAVAALSIVESLHDLDVLPRAIDQLALVRWLQGRHREALELHRRAARLQQENGRQWLAFTLMHLARCSLDAGLVTEARSYLREAWAEVMRFGSRHLHTGLRFLEARAALAVGESDAAGEAVMLGLRRLAEVGPENSVLHTYAWGALPALVWAFEVMASQGPSGDLALLAGVFRDLGPRAVSALAPLAGHPDPSVRHEAKALLDEAVAGGARHGDAAGAGAGAAGAGTAGAGAAGAGTAGAGAAGAVGGTDSGQGGAVPVDAASGAARADAASGAARADAASGAARADAASGAARAEAAGGAAEAAGGAAEAAGGAAETAVTATPVAAAETAVATAPVAIAPAAAPAAVPAPAIERPAGRLRVYLFGGFRMESGGVGGGDRAEGGNGTRLKKGGARTEGGNGTRLEEGGARQVHWKNRKSRAIFAYLLANRGRAVPRDELVDAFWPEADPETAERSFYLALRSIRDTLGGATGAARPVVCRDGAYHLHPELPLWTDVDQFLQHLAAAGERAGRGDAAGAAAELEAAAALYRGDYLAGPGFAFDWAFREQERLREAHLKALERLSDLLESAGDLERAVAVVRRILEIDPCREPAVSRAMAALARSGRHAEAVRLFEAFRDALRRELDLAPSPDTIALCEAIRRQAGGGVLQR